MALSDELTKLHELHQRGAMSDDEFARAKARMLGGTPHPENPLSAINALRRSRSDSWIAGVCGGLARLPAWSPGSGVSSLQWSRCVAARLGDLRPDVDLRPGRLIRGTEDCADRAVRDQLPHHRASFRSRLAWQLH